MFRRLLDSPWPYFVGAGLLLIVAIASQFEFRAPTRSVGKPEQILDLKNRKDLNVLFILVDTMRRDRLSSYGYKRPTTPNIDELASHGIRFTHVISQSSWTKTSMASIWTGTYPANHGIVRYNDVIPDEAVMPAELFEKAGYRTAGIWRNGWVAPNFGFGQGFESYLNPTPGRAERRLRAKHPSGKTIAGSDEDAVVSAFEFLDRFGQKPFFLYLHFMDLHQYTYDDHAPDFGTSYSDVYDQALNWVDRLIGHVVSHLDEIHQRKNTLVVIASDHGEAFMEHGSEGHGRNLYSEVVNVPLVMSLPFALEPGIVVDKRVMNVDIWPTILDMVGLPHLVHPDGESLVPLILASAGIGNVDGTPDRPVIGQLDRRWGNPKKSDPIVSVTDGDWRIVWWPKKPDHSLLFNLVKDPAEKKNLFDAKDPESEHLSEEAKNYYDHAKSPWGVEPPEKELDQLQLNQLRALGYVIK